MVLAAWCPGTVRGVSVPAASRKPGKRGGWSSLSPKPRQGSTTPFASQLLHPCPGDPHIGRFEFNAQVTSPVASGGDGDAADPTERVQHQCPLARKGANQLLALIERLRAGMALGQLIEVSIAEKPVPGTKELRRPIDGLTLVEENDWNRGAARLRSMPC